jgi:serine/threonine protein kinase
MPWTCCHDLAGPARDMTRGAGATPRTLGRYRLDAVIGQGAMGTVWRGFDPVIVRAVAIKVMQTDQLDPGQHGEYLSRFAREVKVAAGCAHPAIVTVHDVGGDLDGVAAQPPFIVMELVEGGSLARHLASPDALRATSPETMLLPILDALAAVHQAGTVHRDIKPANILLTRDHRPKLTDFGIAGLRQHPGGQGLTRTGTMIGTPAYMAPEQARGAFADHRADLFSVGCILHEMLTGATPFGRDGIGPTVLALLGPEPAPLDAVRATAPRYADILARALAKRPDQRFSSASEFTDALMAVADPSVTRHIARPPAPPIAAAASIGAGAPADAAFLQAVSADLVSHLGPITETLVRRAAQQAESRDALLQILATHLSPELRTAFLQAASLSATSHVGTRSDVALSAGVSAQAQQAVAVLLRETIGPIADIVVRRAATKAADPAGFVDHLTTQLKLGAPMRDRLRTAVGATRS